MIKKIIRRIKLLLVGFILAVCIVLGVAVVIPKRKEESAIEVEIITPETNEHETSSVTFIKRVE